MKINVCDVCRDSSLDVVITVGFISDYHVLKTHVIAGQSACLVSEKVLNLSQLLIEGACLDPHLRRFVSLELTFADIDSLQILDHLKSDYQ